VAFFAAAQRFRVARAYFPIALRFLVTAILPNMNYDGLDVVDGLQAGIAWGRLVDPATCAEEKAQLKRALMDYCGQDTLALARTVDFLLKRMCTPAS
jgi:hypothetical protein